MEETLTFELDPMSLERLEQAVDDLREGQQTTIRQIEILVTKVETLETTVGGNGGSPLRDRVVALETTLKMLEKSKAGASAVWLAIGTAILGAVVTGIFGIIIMTMQARHDDEIRQNHEQIKQLEREKGKGG